MLLAAERLYFLYFFLCRLSFFSRVCLFRRTDVIISGPSCFFYIPLERDDEFYCYSGQKRGWSYAWTMAIILQVEKQRVGLQHELDDLSQRLDEAGGATQAQVI